MPEDPTTNMLKELVGQLPIRDAYNDALSPGMKQTGKLIEDITKTVRLALFPLQVTAMLQDKFSAFLRKSVETVPEQRRISPPNQILGPVLEGVKYEDDESLLWGMFSNLLSNSMDEKTARLAHPAFPALIRQLAPDEAVMLKALQRSGAASNRIIAELDSSDIQDIKVHNWKILDGDLQPVKLQFPTSFDLYLFHLNSLNLIQQSYTYEDTDGKTSFTLSSLGEHFMNAVTRGEHTK